MSSLGPVVVLAALLTGAGPPVQDDLAAVLRRLAGAWAPSSDRVQQVEKAIRARIHEANARESRAWEALASQADWEKYRDVRIEALQASLGRFPKPPRDLRLRVRKTLEGNGYRIDNITFESRPGLLVTANLYRPAKPGKAMPGILIIHSHHAPKTQGELQDMGAMWAKVGCLVLVMDQLGHGERRQHPFRTKADYPKPYRIDRQDYHFRYNLAVQLQTIGDSLMGWMVWDVQRGVDLLLSRPGIDAGRIIVLGAVAGGGDPAAVVGALDKRIAAVVPFNFGGPQPETRFPLPNNVKVIFNYAGSGSWESTRNLAYSARDGFLPWVIVGAIAPRRHLYGHEFAWDQHRDPVWQRLGKIHSWYGHPDHLASVHGSGSVSGKPPESTHCTNIGAVHRKGIHQALKKWFGIEPPVDKNERRPAAELLCLDKDEHPETLHQVVEKVGTERVLAARKRLSALEPKEQRVRLREAWSALLGDVKPVQDKVVRRLIKDVTLPAGISRSEIALGPVAVQVLKPAHRPGTRLPVVVMFAQGGAHAILTHRSAEISALLRAGGAVACVELGGTSSLRSRGWNSVSTRLASSALMLGCPSLGARLAELRGVLIALRNEKDIDPKRISLWGDSFAPVNGPGTRVEVPLGLPQPAQAEPLGAILALLCPLFEDGIVSVRARGGLVSYQSLLASRFCHVPSDVVVPGALTAGDLVDILAALAPLPIHLEALVDGRNRPVGQKERERIYAAAQEAYRKAGAAAKLEIVD
jgi:dienelactone hydrolase